MFLKSFAGICACVCLCVCVCVFVLKWGWGEGSTFWSTSCHEFLNYFSEGGGVEWGGLIRAARAKHNFCEGFAFLCLQITQALLPEFELS